MRVAIDAARDVDTARSLFSDWRTAFLLHLEHEEKIMMMWTTKTGSTPYSRSVAFATHILARRDHDWDFHVGWAVRQLRYVSVREKVTTELRLSVT